MTGGKNNFSKILLHTFPVGKSYTWVPKTVNAGCSPSHLWAYRWKEKVAGAPHKKCVSLTQTNFFPSYVSFVYISAMVSNDIKKIITLSLLLRLQMFGIVTASTQTN